MDRFDALGIGIKHAAIPDKLDLGADLTFSRAHSDTTVQTAAFEPPYPTATTSLDMVKLWASYKLKDNLWLDGSYWYESYRSADWHLDGVNPNAVYDLLAFGNAAPRYNVNVFRLSARYAF